MRAKFQCQSVTKSVGQESIKMTPVLSDSEANKSFSKYTPCGAVDLTITNPDAFGFYEPGRAYFVDFTPAD